MPSQKTLGERLAMLAKSKGKTQTAIADSLGMPVSQINRFFRGHSEVSQSNLLAILRELDIDLESFVTKKIRKHVELEDDNIETSDDCVQFLFKSLDELGRQTYLKNLAWASQVTTKQRLPAKVEEILKQELDLI